MSTYRDPSTCRDPLEALLFTIWRDEGERIIRESNVQMTPGDPRFVEELRRRLREPEIQARTIPVQTLCPRCARPVAWRCRVSWLYHEDGPAAPPCLACVPDDPVWDELRIKEPTP